MWEGEVRGRHETERENNNARHGLTISIVHANDICLMRKKGKRISATTIHQSIREPHARTLQRVTE
eukprot:7207208-Alexandrium_andersonii.AAC.1